MTVRVLEIAVPPTEVRDRSPYSVNVKLDVDGEALDFTFTVSDLGLASADAQLVSASSEFVTRFRSERATLRHVQDLVGQAVAGSAVHLPQLVAA